MRHPEPVGLQYFSGLNHHSVMENKKKYVATADSLDFSETVANALGIPFDKNQTKTIARKLHDLYYKDISLVLPEETRSCRFDNFASGSFVAFADQEKNVPLINIDEQWAMFFLDANILTCIRAFHVLTEAEAFQNALIFKENLETFKNPLLHETIREKMKPFIMKYVEILPIANLLTMCMFGFILCHELAHHNLGHIYEVPHKQQELDADTRGFQYLKRVSHQFEQLEFLKIPPNMLGAPVVAMIYLQALEAIGIISTSGDTHPSVSQRTQNLYEQFNKVANEEARYLYNGLHLSCEEFVDEISRIKNPSD